MRTELRVIGRDPAASAEAKAKLRAIQRQRRAEEGAWDAGHGQPSDPDGFRHEILPLIQAVPFASWRP